MTATINLNLTPAKNYYYRNNTSGTVTTLTESGTVPGLYALTVTDPDIDGTIFLRAGGSPAPETDVQAARVDWTDAYMPTTIWAALTSGMTTVGSIGKKLADWVVGEVSSVDADGQQDVADAMLLSPSGTAADGSVMKMLGDINGEDGFGEDDRDTLNTIRQQTGSITGASLIVNTKVNRGTITIYQGDSYSSDEGTAIILTEPTGSGWPTDLTGYTLALELLKDPDNTNTGSDTATITTVAVSPATGAGRNVTIQMSVTDTTALALNRKGGMAYGYDLMARNGTTKACTLSSGGISVLP